VVGFRDEDRLPGDWEPRLQVGFVFDNDWRHRAHPVPVDLMSELPPPPRGYHYYVVGGHIVLVDSGWRVTDVIKINL
jgi:Ni/Co efflux regulator RcnB